MITWIELERLAQYKLPKLNYADYYFLEALKRKKDLEK